jgi:hypothetical protein
MNRKVAQRRTQCAYAHARLHSGSEEYDKVLRTGHTLCSAGVPPVCGPLGSHVPDGDYSDRTNPRRPVCFTQ